MEYLTSEKEKKFPRGIMKKEAIFNLISTRQNVGKEEEI